MIYKILRSLCILLFFTKAFSQDKAPVVIMDMVHHNPGEPLTKSIFTEPQLLQQYGYKAQVINDFKFAHAALTFDKLNPNIFPQGSAERKWALEAAAQVRSNIVKAKAAGLQVYYFTDIIVLPKRLVALYRDEICDKNGKISFERPKTLEIHKVMLDELFATFPDLDGLVIRTGETYLDNVPYHTGNNPITNAEESHVKIINLLREQVCNKFNKKVFYRTWSFGGLHDDPNYYLSVTNHIQPHPNLVFSIKHTLGDYHRTFDFNPTLTLGKHPQVVEVQCQREYEGKGAYPNYVMDGVINGFEEYAKNKPQKGFKSLNDIKSSPNFKGVFSWSRGGGWVGPYIKNELWIRLNTYVISHWAANPKRTELDVFNSFMNEEGIAGKSRKKFRELCLLSAKAVVRGHATVKLPFENKWVWWMRDHFLSGIDSVPESAIYTSEGSLYKAFEYWYERGMLDDAVSEKRASVAIWKKILRLSKDIGLRNVADQQYVQVSSRYGLLLHQIIAEGWDVMATGFIGDKTGKYNTARLKKSIASYDAAWINYKEFAAKNPSAASLYNEYAFVMKGPDYHLSQGMGKSVNKYRKIVNQ